MGEKEAEGIDGKKLTGGSIMKRKLRWILGGLSPLVLVFGFLLLAISALQGEKQKELGSTDGSSYRLESLSPNVLRYRELVEKYCRQYGISDSVSLVLAIMQVESGGEGGDPMQSSESKGLAPNTITSPEESIAQGVLHLSNMIAKAKSLGLDRDSVIQSYNYGGGFLDYVASHGKRYSFALAESFAKEKSGGEKTEYKNPLAIAENGGWRYQYGNMFYARVVNQYVSIPAVGDAVFQTIFTELRKYEGYPYVFGGSNPNSSFDCSGLMQWCFRKAGISLPRTAQEQYSVCRIVPYSEAKPGDLLFFHSTYASANYVTHVGFYVGGGRMFHAGQTPIGFENLSSAYWQSRLIGAGRLK